MNLHSTDSREDQIVRFNVTGSAFATTKTVLMQHPTSFFGKLFEGSLPALKDASGAIFIGRPANYFRCVLDLLHTGSYELSPPMTEQRMQEELLYYGLADILVAEEDEDAQKNVDAVLVALVKQREDHLSSAAAESYVQWKAENDKTASLLLSEISRRFRAQISDLKGDISKKPVLVLTANVFPSVRTIRTQLARDKSLHGIDSAVAQFEQHTSRSVLADDAFFSLCKTDRGCEFLTRYAKEQMQFSLAFNGYSPPAFFANLKFVHDSSMGSNASFRLNTEATGYSGFEGRQQLAGLRFVCTLNLQQ